MVISVEGAYDALKNALVDAQYSDNGCASVDPEVIEVVLAQLKAPKLHAFVLDILERAHDNDPNEHGALVMDLLEGLRELGWTDEPPEPLYPIGVLIDRIHTLASTPWSGDNTYGQGLDDAIGTLQAMYLGKPYVPRWLRCPATKLGNACVRQLPHEEHASAGGTKWTNPKVKTQGADQA